MIKSLAIVFLLVLSVGVTVMWHHHAFARSGDDQPTAAEVTPDPWPKIIQQNEQ